MNAQLYGAIRRDVARIYGSTSEFDDLVQEAAIAYLRGTSWMNGMADHIRSVNKWKGTTRDGTVQAHLVSANAVVRTSPSGDVTVLDTIADPNVDVEGQATRTRLSEILARLTPRQQVVALMLANNIQAKDIADHLGVSESRVSQIVAQIRGRLEDDVPHADPAVPVNERREYVIRRRNEGATNQQIARELCITVNGVLKHVVRARREGRIRVGRGLKAAA